MRELIVTGAGPGADEQLTVAAVNSLKNADCIVAAPRHIPLAEKFKKDSAEIITLGNFKETFNKLAKFEKIENQYSVVIIVSGDPGIYSLLPLVKKYFPEVELKVLPGISSLQSLCAAAGEMWHDAVILSGHGRPLSDWKFLNTVERNKLTLLFCGEDHNPEWAVNLIKNAAGGLANHTEIVIGERLSYPDECITIINSDKNINLNKKFDSLAIVLIKNNAPWTPPSGRLKDTDFERDNSVPMTREEVRSIIIDRLNLNDNSVFFDIGAGTGSISASAALEFPDCEVHAIECDDDALSVINKNREKFKIHNLQIHAGYAVKVLEDLIDNKKIIPTNIFIGGSGGELGEIIRRLENFNSPVRVLISAVTLETLSEAVNLLNNNKKWRNLEAVQAAISATRTLGRSLLMSARNPVTILSADLNI